MCVPLLYTRTNCVGKSFLHAYTGSKVLNRLWLQKDKRYYLLLYTLGKG